MEKYINLILILMLNVIFTVEIKDINAYELSQKLNHHDHIFIITYEDEYNVYTNEIIKEMSNIYFKHIHLHVNILYFKHKIISSTVKRYIEMVSNYDKDFKSEIDIDNNLTTNCILYLKKNKLVDLIAITSTNYNTPNLFHNIFIQHNFIKIKGEEDFINEKNKYNSEFIILFNGNINNDLMQELVEVIPSHSNDNFLFLYSQSKRDYSILGNKIKINSLYMYKDSDKKMIRFTGHLDYENEYDLQNFLYHERYPPIVPLDNGGYDMLIKNNNFGVLLIIKNENNEENHKVLKEFESFGEENKNKMVLTYCYITEQSCLELLKELDIIYNLKEEGNYILRYIVKHKSSSKDDIDVFKMLKSFSEEFEYNKAGFKSFVEQFNNGLLIFDLRTERGNLEKDIKEVTYINFKKLFKESLTVFNDIVLIFFEKEDEDKVDNFIKELLKVVKGHEKITIGKYNINENSVIKKKVTHIINKPLIKLYKAKQYYEYNDDTLLFSHDHLLNSNDESILFLIDHFSFNVQDSN